jgi:hypothetical protein
MSGGGDPGEFKSFDSRMVRSAESIMAGITEGLRKAEKARFTHDIYSCRKKGIEYCQTNGSDHYKGTIEPIDIMMSIGVFEGFAVGNMIKYARRFVETKNPDDLKKVADYAHILCGYQLSKPKEYPLVECPLCKRNFKSKNCPECGYDQETGEI